MLRAVDQSFRHMNVVLRRRDRRMAEHLLNVFKAGPV